MNKTWLLFWDELNGFAKSSLMIGMWLGLPAMGVLLYFLLPSTLPMATGVQGQEFTLPASTFISTIVGSTGGLLAAMMVSIDIVNEKNKKVYDLFLIRPVSRGAFMWSKFFAVSVCVTLALAFALFGGILLDLVRGVEISPVMRETIFEQFLSGAGVVIISTAAGILIGMLSSSVLMAVLLVWFVGQYAMLVPMLAAFIANDYVQWISWGLTAAISVVFVVASSWLFKRLEV